MPTEKRVENQGFLGERVVRKHSVNPVFYCMPFIVYERGISKTYKTFGVDLEFLGVCLYPVSG